MTTLIADGVLLGKIHKMRIDLKQKKREAQKSAPMLPIVEWAEKYYYIPETSEPIVFEEHQKAVLSNALVRESDGHLRYQTIIYSTVKKGGKTRVSGAVGRWAAETWGPYQEILCVGNDADQAKERAFAAISQSIELTPDYNRSRRILPDRWRLLDAEATSLVTGSKIKAIATDYKGEAGANPSITCWTELWGMIDKAATRFWAEMAPSPTRRDSIRWVETYMGYEGESELLWGLYESAILNGRQLRAIELGEEYLGCFEEAPNPDDLVPCYVNEAAGIFAYYDHGEAARRMPWQRGERGARYYANEAATQTPSQMIRLHSNEWVSAESAFIEMEWFDACYNPLPLMPGEKTTMVMALDAAVSGDCFGMTLGSRDPDSPADSVALRLARKWDPPKGGKIDFSEPEKYIANLCGYEKVEDDGAVKWVKVPGMGYNIVEVAYDPYQLHDLATRMQKAGIAWFRPFSQGEDRLKADKGLYDLIVQRRFRHDGNLDVREHLANCNAQQAAKEDTRLRLVKKSENRKIDLAVCTSMMSAEIMRLNI